MKISYLPTDDGIVLIQGGMPLTINRSSSLFNELVFALGCDDADLRVQDLLAKLNDPDRLVVGQDAVSVYIGKERQVINGVTMAGTFAKAVRTAHECGLPLAPLAKFAEKSLKAGIDPAGLDRLYKLVQQFDTGILENGNFLGYALVTHNRMDLGTESLRHNLGEVVFVVPTGPEYFEESKYFDPAPKLEVMGKDAATVNATADERVLVCEVSPSDIAVIPDDIGVADPALRVLRYKVVGEWDSETKEVKLGCELASQDDFVQETVDKILRDTDRFIVGCFADTGFVECSEEFVAKESADERYSQLMAANRNAFMKRIVKTTLEPKVAETAGLLDELYQALT